MDPMPGFTADASLYKTRAHYWMGGGLVHAVQLQGQDLPAPSHGRIGSTHTLLCALAFQDCVTNGLCDWYFANCPQPSGGGGGDNAGGGGGSRPPGPIHIA